MATSYILLPLLTLCFYGISFIEAHKGGFTVPLIHRDSPKSPFYNPNETLFQKINKAFHRSFNRLNHFYPQARPENVPQSEIITNHGEYLVTYSIGTPPFEIIGIADTGSDLIWSQCMPCQECYDQTSPLFDPSKSITYEPVPCSSRVCHSLYESSCNTNSSYVPTCNYIASYGDGSHSQGNLAYDTITLGSTTGSPIAFPKIPIGCGFDNRGTFDSQGSGIVGLGGGAVSLISQIGPSIEYKFSYCLVPLFEPNSTSKLNFGENAVVAGSDTVSTPLFVSARTPTFYYLNLEGISVGYKRINFVGDSTSSVTDQGNIIIDSGTTLTILPIEFYYKLEYEVASHIRLERASDPGNMLNLCYKVEPNSIVAPNITAHFTGADVVLSTLNTFVSVSDSVTCFAFYPAFGGYIYGNLAQMNYLIGYDLQKKIVSFKPFDCTHM